VPLSSEFASSISSFNEDKQFSAEGQLKCPNVNLERDMPVLPIGNQVKSAWNEAKLFRTNHRELADEGAILALIFCYDRAPDFAVRKIP
jgi:hypothetical protein